jgi:hypothetical protein
VVVSWAVFSAETRWEPMLEGPKNRRGSPNTKTRKQRSEARNSWKMGRQRVSKGCSCLKSSESLYTCPRAPFYRETKGLLHSENTLESKEYS